MKRRWNWLLFNQVKPLTMYLTSNIKDCDWCTYHVVWTPKYRFRVLEGLVKELLDHDIPMLFEWKSCEMIELNIQKDHVHLIISVPPKISISQLMVILKDKTAVKIFKSYPQLRTKPYWAITSGLKDIVLTQSVLTKTRSKNT